MLASLSPACSIVVFYTGLLDLLQHHTTMCQTHVTKHASCSLRPSYTRALTMIRLQTGSGGGSTTVNTPWYSGTYSWGNGGGGSSNPDGAGAAAGRLAPVFRHKAPGVACHSAGSRGSHVAAAVRCDAAQRCCRGPGRPCSCHGP